MPVVMSATLARPMGFPPLGPAPSDPPPTVSAIDGFHDWLERWAPLAEWGVAIRTAMLALATVWLASRTKEAADAAREEVTQIAEQGRATLRAYVYPEATHEWAWGRGSSGDLRDKVLPLRNGGPGVALNVEGQVQMGTEGMVITLYASSIAPGQAINARLAQPVSGRWGAWQWTWHGELRYGDLNGDFWTTFRVSVKEGQLVIEHESPSRAGSLEPTAA